MARRGFPTFTPVVADVIEFEMLVPSGQPGVRWNGQRVIVRIDRSFGVEVREAVFGQRVIVSGAWNLISVCWGVDFDACSEWELCWTALEMIDAQVAATAKLFRRRFLDASWLDARSYYEVMS